MARLPRCLRLAATRALARRGCARRTVARHGRAWAAIRAAVEQHGAYTPLAAHLGARDSKCLIKRADKLAAWDAAGIVPAYRG
jgi:hypothetical protein